MQPDAYLKVASHTAGAGLAIEAISERYADPFTLLRLAIGGALGTDGGQAVMELAVLRADRVYNFRLKMAFEAKLRELEARRRLRSGTVDRLIAERRKARRRSIEVGAATGQDAEDDAGAGGEVRRNAHAPVADTQAPFVKSLQLAEVAAAGPGDQGIDGGAHARLHRWRQPFEVFLGLGDNDNAPRRTFRRWRCCRWIAGHALRLLRGRRVGGELLSYRFPGTSLATAVGLPRCGSFEAGRTRRLPKG